MRRFSANILITLSLSCLTLSSADQTIPQSVATIAIRDIPLGELQALKMNPHFNWWSELGDTLVVGGTSSNLKSAGVSFTGLWPDLTERDLQIVVAGHKNELPDSTKMVAKGGHISLIIRSLDLKPDEHMSVRNFNINTVYVQSSDHIDTNKEWTDAPSFSAQQISGFKSQMDQVDGVRWFSDVGTLTNWNRHVSSIDIVSARDWIKTQFETLAPTSTALQKFTVNGRDAWNVVATFDGGPGSDIYIVGGHYDSLSEQTSRTAPGAEDNASGAAGVIELARVFSKQKQNATLIFITFSGEEEGLIGSRAFVRNMPSEMKARIKAVLTMDMIGYSKDNSEDVLLETSNEFKSLSDRCAAASKLVDGLRFYTSFNPFGSDHMPFIDNNIPAILTIDNDWGDYPAYHRTTDTIDKVSRDMGTAILKMNAGALAMMLENGKKN